jgi:hypothetical protein
MIGRLVQCRYTVTPSHSCMRNCRHLITSKDLLTPVMCAGPETEPHNSREDEIELIVIEAKGVVAVVGTDRSTTQLVSLDREQGVRVFGADDGRMMCVLLWFDIEVEVAVVERDGRSLSLAGSVGAGCGLVSVEIWTLGPRFSVFSFSSSIFWPSSCVVSLAGVLT